MDYSTKELSVVVDKKFQPRNWRNFDSRKKILSFKFYSVVNVRKKAFRVLLVFLISCIYFRTILIFVIMVKGVCIT